MQIVILGSWGLGKDSWARYSEHILPQVQEEYWTLQFQETGIVQCEFMQDNAPVRKTKIVLMWSEEKGIPLL